ncbi:MAG: SDR family oxidoreductase [Anaerolineae bacterium]|nr:SDR family oxidoreductase [Anaerolineae bacterium]
MILDLFKLDGQVALVTGGGTALCHAVATALAEAGADTAVLYTDGFDDTRQAIIALGRRCMGVQLDLARATVPQLQGAVQQVGNQLGRLDVLVNCASSARHVPALDYAETDWDEALRTTLRASFFLCQAAGAYFRQQGHGKIVNVASLDAGPVEGPSVASMASNSGLLGLTRLLANEWAPLGINVNCIIPGHMDIDPAARPEGDERPDHPLLDRIPARRLGTPQDLQGAVVYLASHASDYVHGASLLVDGGWLVR